MDIWKLVEEGKIKRVFRAREKVSYPGACCHITQRAPGRELLFLENSDYLYMLKLLKEHGKKFNYAVYSFALMSNHVHLQLRLADENLPAAMKALFQGYARYFNSKYKRKGHVFCGAYREALCLDDAYALATSVYIHMNPVKAGLAADPYAYRWSSCGLYSPSTKLPSFVEAKFILGLLARDQETSRAVYKQILDRAVHVQCGEVLENPDAMNSYRTRLMEAVSSLGALKNTLLKGEPDVLDETALDKKIAELREKHRLHKPQDLKARKYLAEQLKARGFRINQIAEKLGVTRRTIYQSLSSQNPPSTR